MSEETPPPKPASGDSPPASDAVQFTREKYELTSEDVFAFLTEKEVAGAGACIVCKTDLWGSVTPKDGGTVNLIIGDMNGLIGGGAINCVGLVCSNCGNVRLHATDPMVRWKREKTGASV